MQSVADRDDSRLLDRTENVRRASPWRWWALIVFSTMSCVQNICWITYSASFKATKQYYNISPTETQRLVEIATIVFIPAAFIAGPMGDRFGLRTVTILSSAFVCAGGLVRAYFHGYIALFIGQGLNGMAGPTIMNAPPQLAAQWFPLHQRVSDSASLFVPSLFTCPHTSTYLYVLV